VPHGEYDASTSTFAIATAWNEKDLVQQVAGARWDAENRTWRVPATWPAVVQLRGVFGPSLTLGQSLIDYVWKLRRERIDVVLELRTALEPIDDRSIELEVIRSWRT
jgi:hypothetical protein